MIVCKMGHVVLLLYLLATICRTTALIDGLYCGNENCYDGRPRFITLAEPETQWLSVFSESLIFIMFMRDSLRPTCILLYVLHNGICYILFC